MRIGGGGERDVDGLARWHSARFTIQLGIIDHFLHFYACSLWSSKRWRKSERCAVTICQMDGFIYLFSDKLSGFPSCDDRRDENILEHNIQKDDPKKTRGIEPSMENAV